VPRERLALGCAFQTRPLRPDQGGQIQTLHAARSPRIEQKGLKAEMRELRILLGSDRVSCTEQKHLKTQHQAAAGRQRKDLHQE
jgi:hypothetical protein